MGNSDNNNKDLGPLVPEMIAMLGGIMSAVILVMPLSTLLGFLGILVAPVVEEVCKVCGLFLMAAYYPGALKYKKQGILLGALAGLGFAFTENLFYFIRAEMGFFGMEAVETISLVRVLPLVGHITWSSLVGAGIVSHVQKRIDNNSNNAFASMANTKKSHFSLLLMTAIALHLVYNFSAFQYGWSGAVTVIIGSFILCSLILTNIKDKHYESQNIRPARQDIAPAVASEGKGRVIVNPPASPVNRPVRQKPINFGPVEAKKAVITGVSGYYAGKSINLEEGQGRLIFGRDPGLSHIIYPDNYAEISRQHCIILYDGNKGDFVIEDSSSNGTYIVPSLKLQKGQKYPLNQGARFYLSDPKEMFEFRWY